MSRRRLATAVAAVAASVIVAAPAAAMVNVKINPAKPIVDDSTITVSMKVPRTLKAGYHWQASVLGASCRYAANLVWKDSKQKPKKGKLLTVRLSSWDDLTNGGSEWCQGKFNVMINTARDSDDSPVSLVGMGDGRFYGKP